MKIIKSLTIASLLFTAGTSAALASSFYDYAKVVKARPVYEYVRVSQPVQQCYPVERRVRQHGHHGGHHSGSTIAGAVIGGVIGGVIGDSSETALAGAVIGGAIGHSEGHARHRGHYRTRVVEHCETHYEPAKKVRKLKGYKVKYRYKGQAYRTFMRHHPGDSVKVRVSLSPVGYD